MRGRALVLGSATGALTGVANDVAAMAGWLGSLGLALDVREGPDATRAGMLEGLDRLAREVRPGQAAVVYYSGHGGFSAVGPESRFLGARLAPRAFQYLVPTDHDKHRAFRGIFRAELSWVIRAIEERTANVTVILDCCHSTDMVRDDDLELKAVVEPWTEGIEAHVAWLEAQGHALERLPELRSPSLVLVAACEAARKAFEHTRAPDGLRCGVFTDGLLEVAAALDDPTRVPWDAVVRRVVARLRRLRSRQRPQVSGPAFRCVLSERTVPRTGALVLQGRPGQWGLDGGEAVGVVVGDRYHVVDPLDGEATHSRAEVEVAAVAGHAAELTVLSASGELEAGMIALPRAGGPEHQRCVLAGSGPLVVELRRRLAAIGGVVVVDPGDDDGRAELFVEARDDRVEVLDAQGRLLRWPWRDVPAIDPVLRDERLDGLAAEIGVLARTGDLLALARRAGRAEHPRALSHVFEWGRVERGLPRRLPAHGATLHVGDRIYVRVENTASRALHVSLLDVGVGRGVVLLNRNEPEGIDLAAGDTEIFGAPELRGLVGVGLAWPEAVPPDGPREESLVLFLSSAPMPVGAWETRARPDVVRRDQPPAPRRSQGVASLVRYVSFSLHPRPADARGPAAR